MRTDEHMDRCDEVTDAARDYANGAQKWISSKSLTIKFKTAPASTRNIKNK